VLIAIAIYIIFATAGISIYLPYGNFELNYITRDENGDIYGVSNGAGVINVYQMDSDGKAKELYRCESESSEVDTICRYSDGAVYVGQMWYEDGNQNFSIWKKDTLDRKFSRVWERTLDDNVEISDFYVNGNVFRMMGINQSTNDILVYSYDDGNDNLVQFANEIIPTDVMWGNDGLYILSQDNHIYYSDLEGNKTESDIENVVLMFADEDGYYYQQRDSRDLTYIFYNGLGGYTYSDLGDVWNIQHSDRASNSAMLLFADGNDRLMIVSQDGNSGHYVDSFKLGVGKTLKKCIVPLLVVTIVYVTVLIFVYLFAKLVWSKKKLRYQTMAALVVGSGIWLAVMLVILWVYEVKNNLNDMIAYSRICSTIQKGRLEDEADIYSLNYENYIGSVQQEKIEKIFENNVIGNAWKELLAKEEIVYGYENPVFLFSDVAAYGRRVDTYYYASTINCIKECMETGVDQLVEDKVSERKFAIYITRIGNQNQQLCLVTRIPVNGIEEVHSDLKYFYLITLIGWIIMMIYLRNFLKKKWSYAEVIVTQMEKVSRGDYHIENKNVPDNEFGTIWMSLERMCKNIQIQRYRNTDTLDYIYQFAPQNFETLFNKEKLQDIEIGETLQISATVGIISVIDKDTLLTGRLQKQYVQYANQLMEILFSQEQSEQAIFLQNGSNLENVKVIFKEDSQSAITAVRYSVDCIETLLGLTEKKYDTKPFILLHTSQFSCGVAGGSRQIYPYVTSLELETLGIYVEQLKYCGVRMVVTKNTWLQVEGKVSGRYIGYVKSKDQNDIYDLYEILDAYAQSQKLSRLKNMENFNNALKLYYANDLYLARSLFSDIVKECPDDGIARWYAFACDELFNREDRTNVRYDLFWDLL
jgi:hypothetical protein